MAFTERMQAANEICSAAILFGNRLQVGEQAGGPIIAGGVAALDLATDSIAPLDDRVERARRARASSASCLFRSAASRSFSWRSRIWRISPGWVCSSATVGGAAAGLAAEAAAERLREVVEISSWTKAVPVCGAVLS